MITKQLAKKLFIPSIPTQQTDISDGLFHYLKEKSGTYTRFHLRIDPDGWGMLLVNATAAARLSPSGVIIAQGLLEGLDEVEIGGRLKQNFRGVSKEMMKEDLEKVAALIANLATPGDNYPILNFEDAEISPFEAELMAPFQADIPLAPVEQLNPILDRLWSAGIPHVVFLVNDGQSGKDLIQVVEHAEDLGMIAGVRGRASDFNRDDLIYDLAVAGLDHFNLLYVSSDSTIHDAILGQGDNHLAASLFIQFQEYEIASVAELPLVESTIDLLEETLETIQSSGIHNVNFFAIASPDEMPDEERDGALKASAMPQIANMVEETANLSEVRFIWQPPVLREPVLSLSQQIRYGARCSSDVSIHVESNGDVIPARGPYTVAGNILKQDWQMIWAHENFIAYRTRVERPTHCDECPDLVICAVDCPKKVKGWSHGRGIR